MPFMVRGEDSCLAHAIFSLDGTIRGMGTDGLKVVSALFATEKFAAEVALQLRGQLGQYRAVRAEGRMPMWRPDTSESSGKFIIVSGGLALARVARVPGGGLNMAGAVWSTQNSMAPALFERRELTSALAAAGAGLDGAPHSIML